MLPRTASFRVDASKPSASPAGALLLGVSLAGGTLAAILLAGCGADAAEKDSGTAVDEPTPRTIAVPIDDAAAAAAAHARARMLVDALERSDFETYVACLPRPFLAISGGRSHMLATVRDSVPKLAAAGYELLGSEVDAPTRLYARDAERYAIMPTRLRVRMLGEETVRLSFVLAVSEDSGDSWHVIDGGQLQDSAQRIWPNFPAEIELPKVD